MTDEQKYYGFQDGMPTGPDVEKLLKAFPELSNGDRIEYQSVKKLLNLDWRSNRWKSVTDAWRKRLEIDHGIIIKCDDGKAFYAATPGQISSSIYGVLMGVGRKLKRTRRKAIRVNTDDEAQRLVLDHQCLVLHSLERETRKQRMNILPSTKLEDQSKIAAPKSSNCV